MSFTYLQLKTAVQDYTENNETTFVNNIPMFIRISEEIEITGTFKYKKTDLVKDGFDPSVVKDKIGANHFNRAFKIILRSKIVDFLFFESLGSQ